MIMVIELKFIQRKLILFKSLNVLNYVVIVINKGNNKTLKIIGGFLESVLSSKEPYSNHFLKIENSG